MDGESGSGQVTWLFFRERYLNYSKINHRANTYERDCVAVKLFEYVINPRLPADLNHGNLDLYKEHRVKTGNQASTVNREMGTLKSMARRAMEWGYVPQYDMRRVKKLKEEKKIRPHFEQDQVERIRAAAAARGIRFRARVDMALYTGFRRSEMLMIRWEDVNLKDNMIELKSHGSRTIKDYEERRIQMHKNLRETLLEWKKECRSEYVLEDLNEDVLTRWWKRFLRSLGLKGTTHTIRHTVGTHLVRRIGSDLAKDFLGHASAKTTEIYSHQKSELVPVESLNY